MNNREISSIIILLSIVFGVVETSYFGWNFFPESPEELTCDIIALFGFSIGYYLRNK